MKILVIGSGGREHALVWKIAQSKQVSAIYCAPGNAGTGMMATNVAIKADDIPALLDFARKNNIGLTVVGPEVPLVQGIVDVFQAKGLKIFGPTSDGAKLEGSKSFSKQILMKYNIPTAQYRSFTELKDAQDYIRRKGAPIVVKADGLAAGKGVTVAMTQQEALDAVQTIMGERIFGEAGAQVVIEEFMSGEEASILAFCDGRNIVPMTSAQDHKRVFDGDKGPNTGGMGAYSPAPVVTAELDKVIYDKILLPTMEGLLSEGIEYKGVLYAGLMLTAQGPKVVEFNARFGDPETQVILPRLKNDLVEVMQACVNGRLDKIDLEWYEGAAITVVMAAGGYPGNYAKGKIISGFESVEKGTVVFHAGTATKEGKVVSAGGRVLNVTSTGKTLKEAVTKVYKDIQKISFEGAFYRKDIAARGLRS